YAGSPLVGGGCCLRGRGDRRGEPLRRTGGGTEEERRLGQLDLDHPRRTVGPRNEIDPRIEELTEVGRDRGPRAIGEFARGGAWLACRDRLRLVQAGHARGRAVE